MGLAVIVMAAGQQRKGKRRIAVEHPNAALMRKVDEQRW
jgi:hypothetical protein